MKIAKLTIKNFLKLRDVELNPSKTNVIVGKNKQGKTSILKAIQSAFEGKLDESAIRLGENKAEIIVELDDITIRRSITTSGSSLDLSNKEGMKYPAPQKYLDGLIGSFAFNPVAFFEMKAADQKKYLLEAIPMTLSQDELATYTGEKLEGIDYGAHALDVVAAAHKFYYDQRTGANAEVTKKRKSLDELKGQVPEGFDPTSFSQEKADALRKQITDASVSKERHEAIVRERGTLMSERERLVARIKEIDEIVATQDAAIASYKEVDTSALEAELVQLDRNRDLVHTFKQVQTLTTELSNAVGNAERLDGIVKRLTKEVPQALIAKAALPVEGLSVSEDGLTVNGVALENLSGAEQLKVALAVTRSLNSKFGIICIDGIERLDQETFEAFLKECAEDGYQYFVSRVDGAEAEKKGYILVEDGEVKQSTS